MSIHTNEDYESVDLTEDEQSCEANFSHESSSTHFVNCANTVSSLSTILSRQPPPLTPIKDITCSQVARQTLVCTKVPNIIKIQETKSKSNLSQNNTKKFIGKFTSVQVNPPSSTISETQDLLREDPLNNLETVSIDSNDEEPDSTSSKQENSSHSSIYSPKQPGKVIIIKKNNKYYKIVIPHNVMPSINQSSGPVLINIPEVGPLVITSDPQITKPDPNVKPHTTQQLVNLDDIDQRLSEMQNSVPAEIPKKAQEYSEKQAALYNKKFCWTYCRGRKRDLEGFTINDRLGFSHADGQRSKRCLRILDLLITKKGTRLIKLMNKYNKFQKSTNKKKKMKLVKINEIVGNTPKMPKKVGQGKQEPQQETNTIITDYDSDLLLTKKVVILGANDKEIEVENQRATPSLASKRRGKVKGGKGRKMQERLKLARARRAYDNRSAKKKKNMPVVKPCYVEMVRDERVEKAYRRLRKEATLNHTWRPSLSSVSKSQIREPKRTVKQKTKVESNVRGVKANLTSGQKQPPFNQKEFLQNITNIFCSRVITSEEHFKREMNFLKPVLIVNEHNLSFINYSNEFSKNNVLYIVEESRKFPVSFLKNEDFISAVELGYMKLVDSHLFCKYVMGRINVTLARSDNCVRDHSYCTYKK